MSTYNIYTYLDYFHYLLNLMLRSAKTLVASFNCSVPEVELCLGLNQLIESSPILTVLGLLWGKSLHDKILLASCGIN